MHQLGKLIQRIQDENGWTNVDVANRAIERGHSTSKQSIGEYKNKPIKTIGVRQVSLLADALGVAPIVVVRAAAESMGFHDQDDSEDELEQVVRTTTELSERDKRLVMSLLDAMRTEESSEHASTTPDPNSNVTRLRGKDDHAEDSQSEQMTPLPSLEEAAHPDFELERDRFERAHGADGEESQDPDQ